jgi:hypothetical protein
LIAAAAAAVAGALALLETYRRYKAPLRFYRGAWPALAVRFVVNAAAAAALAAAAEARTDLDGLAIVLATGLAGPAALRSRVISVGRRLAVADLPGGDPARRKEYPAGPALLYDQVDDWTGQRIASALLSAQNLHVRAVAPRLRAAGETSASLLADLIEYLALLPGDDTARRLTEKSLKAAAADPVDEGEVLERLVKKAMLLGWHRRLRDRLAELEAGPPWS